MKKFIYLTITFFLIVAQERSAAQTLSFSLTPPVQCYSAGNNTAIAFVTVPVPGASNYSWTITSPTTACPSQINFSGSGTVATISFSCCGEYTITCSAYNPTTAISSISSTAMVVCPNFISISTPTVNVCSGSSASLLASGATSYTWNNGVLNATNVVTPLSTTCYTVVGLNNITGCMGTAVSCLSVFPNPVASLSLSPGPNGQMTFISTSSNTNISSTYHWQFPQAGPSFTTSSFPQTTTTYTSNGNFLATFTVTNGTGCWDSTMIWVNISNVGTSTNCPITANFTHTPGPNGQMNFTNLSTGTGSFVTFLWDFGTGTTSPAFSPSYTYPNNGTFTVTLTVQSTTNASCFSTHTAVISVTNHTVPACNASYSFSVLPGGLVTYTSTSTGVNAGTSYTWSFFPPATSSVGINLTQITKTYTSNGVKWVTLSISNPTLGCYSNYSDSVSINVNPVPCSVTIAYTPPSSSTSCNGSATVTAVSGLCPGPYTYTWTNGTQGSPTVNNLCFGTYAVIVASASGGTNCCSSSMGTVSVMNCTFSAGISAFQTSPNTFSFSANSSAPSPQCTWYFGDGITSSGSLVIHSYSTNNTFTPQLQATDNSGCSFITSTVVTVSVCPLIATFTSTPLGGGLHQFYSASQYALPNAQFAWNFGSGYTPASSSPSITQQFYVNGSYTVLLAVMNSPTCRDTIALVLPITDAGNCNLNASFTYTTAPNGMVNFISTSTGTNSMTTYTWDYGDNSSNNGVNLSQTNHTYALSGNYPVTLTLKNGVPTCISSTVITISAINTVCALSSNYSHTVGTQGNVIFNNTSVGTNTNTTWHWDFGDGFSTTAQNPTHTYVSAGVYLVKLKALDAFNGACQDSITQALNITGISCLANTNFTLVPSGTPKFWYAIPSYPWNVTAATWHWGDGTSSNSLYASHLYSVAANYNICVSVTVSCGSSGSACATYYVYRSAEQSSDIIGVNVVPPTGTITSVAYTEMESIQAKIYPNPNKGSFHLNVLDSDSKNITCDIFDFTGKLFYSNKGEMTESFYSADIEILDAPSGIYFVRISTEHKTLTRKIIIDK